MNASLQEVSNTINFLFYIIMETWLRLGCKSDELLVLFTQSIHNLHGVCNTKGTASVFHKALCWNSYGKTRKYFCILSLFFQRFLVYGGRYRRKEQKLHTWRHVSTPAVVQRCFYQQSDQIFEWCCQQIVGAQESPHYQFSVPRSANVPHENP